jgi:exonuclease VII large subunit
MQLEAEKNKLENLLTNNLVRRKDELVQALQEISVEDRQRQLDSSKTQLADIEKRLVKVNEDFKAQNEKVTGAMKKVNISNYPMTIAFIKKQFLIHISHMFSKKQSLPKLRNGS